MLYPHVERRNRLQKMRTSRATHVFVFFERRGHPMRRWILMFGLVCSAPALEGAAVSPFVRSMTAVAASSSEPSADKSADQRSPEEKMARRFPQKIRVGDLVGLPMLDWSDRTIGYVQ